MKTCELIIEQRQPTCELDVTHKDDGTIAIMLDHNGLWVKYEFTEEYQNPD